jgi:hypothetical protein
MGHELFAVAKASDPRLVTLNIVNLLKMAELTPRTAAAHSTMLAESAHLLVADAVGRLAIVDELLMNPPVAAGDHHLLMPSSHFVSSSSIVSALAAARNSSPVSPAWGQTAFVTIMN